MIALADPEAEPPQAANATKVPEEDFRDLHVRLVSGALVDTPHLPADTAVGLLLAQVVAAASPTASVSCTGQLLLDGRLLDPQESLAQACAVNGSTLTLVLVERLWHQPLLGEKAQLTREEGRNVVRRNFDDFVYGLVVARRPCRRFRLRVVDNSGNWSGAAELGFTATPVEELPQKLPSCASELENTTVMGNSGAVEINGRTVEEAADLRSNWHMSWQAGDLVTVFISGCDSAEPAEPEAPTEGSPEESLTTGDTPERDVDAASSRFCIDVNGILELKVRIPMVTPDVVLYPLIGLYGATQAVELLEPDLDPG